MSDTELRDRLAIESVLLKYARACDSPDWDLFRSLFTEDAHIDYVSSIGVAGSRDQIAEWLSIGLGTMTFIQHYVTNIESDVAGDTATARAMFYTPFGAPGAAELSYTGGYYHVTLVRAVDGWQMSSLREEAVWAVNMPENAATAVPPPTTFK